MTGASGATPASPSPGAAAATLDADVLIVGGGLVGFALAVALEPLGLDVVLVEARDAGALEQPSFDARVTALANGSRRILEGLGLWSAVEADAQPIRTIHVSERGRFGATRLTAQDEGVQALGYTIENRRLGEVLWARLCASPSCRVLSHARLTHIEREGVRVRASVDHAGTRVTVHGRALVAADGARSRVRAMLGIAASEDIYGQKALIVNCATEKPHAGVAFERFVEHGPLAVLPLTGDRVGVVWTLPAAEADRLATCAEDEFRDALQRAFGYRLGAITRVGTRALHPLTRLRSESLGRGPVVLVGNAAVTLHPVAGQGFNLALRDVASLAELIAQAGLDADADAAGSGHRIPSGDGHGFATLAEDQAARRAADQRRISAFTHGLIGLFGARGKGLGAARGLGLAAFDVLPGAKSVFARHTMGMAGRLPRLARGLPLRSRSRDES